MAGINKELPKPPVLEEEGEEYEDAPPPPSLSPSLVHGRHYSPPVVVQRAETMKSVGGSIIELYAGRGGLEQEGYANLDDDDWERQRVVSGGGEKKGWAEWL